MNDAGAVKPFANVVVNVNGPVAGAVPTLVIVTGINEVTPSVNAGDGCPIVVVKSGRKPNAIGAVGVIVPVLFAVVVSVGNGAVVPVIVGVVPAVPIAGVTGILNVVTAVGAKPAVFGVVQLTV